MKAKVSISRRGMLKGDNTFYITIEDDSSGMRVLSVSMNAQEFAECITGLAYCKAEFENIPNQFIIDNIGKTKQTKPIFVEKPSYLGETASKEAVHKSIKESGELKDGWMIWSDGCTSQQNSDKGHKVILYRYV